MLGRWSRAGVCINLRLAAPHPRCAGRGVGWSCGCDATTYREVPDARMESKASTPTPRLVGRRIRSASASSRKAIPSRREHIGVECLQNHGTGKSGKMIQIDSCILWSYHFWTDPVSRRSVRSWQPSNGLQGTTRRLGSASARRLHLRSTHTEVQDGRGEGPYRFR